MTLNLRTRSLMASLIISLGFAACSETGTTDQTAEPDTQINTPANTDSDVTTEPATGTDTDTDTDTDPEANLPPLKAGQKMARCVIGPERYDGPCVFQSESNGSFYISKRDESPFYGEVTIVSVYVTDAGQAEVRGLTTNGNNSRWGAAERSADDKACWLGTDFSVCAY